MKNSTIFKKQKQKNLTKLINPNPSNGSYPPPVMISLFVVESIKKSIWIIKNIS